MAGDATATRSAVAPLWGELRYSGELARLLAGGEFLAPRRRPGAQPVLLIPGFMAGDASMVMLRSWLRRRGHRVSMSGIRANVDCAERLLGRLQVNLRDLAGESGRPVFLIGQSRGGALARSLAVRNPDIVSGLVMLGTPVRDPLAVSSPVLQTVRWVARLGDLGLPGVLSSTCKDGECCASFRADLDARPPASVMPAHRAAMGSSTGRRAWTRMPSGFTSTRVTVACRYIARSTRCSTACSTSLGRPHGVDEPHRLVVPARGERDHTHAHRRSEHLRWAATTV
jgi:pimeloyl-ACP methyl ester carboxylesterase